MMMEARRKFEVEVEVVTEASNTPPLLLVLHINGTPFMSSSAHIIGTPFISLLSLFQYSPYLSAPLISVLPLSHNIPLAGDADTTILTVPLP